MRSAYVLVAVALSTSSCSQAMTNASGGELAWLRGQQEIVAVHYAAKALQAQVEKSEAEAAGGALSTEIALEDPVTHVKERVIAGLNTAGEIQRIRPRGLAMNSDDLKSLKQALGPPMALDVKTLGWGLAPCVEDPKTFVALYRVRTRIIRLDKEQVVSHSDLACAFAGVALTAQDLRTLRTLLTEATASPWGSEVQFRGTVDGAAFKAKMDKGSSGRVEFGFEGLPFDDEAPRSSSDLGVRQDVTLRIFEQSGTIRWESRRHSAGQEISRGSRSVASSEDGIVLLGRRRDARSSATVPVHLPTISARGDGGGKA